jgi:putative tryptophan/tyrosine transport system substrate-binding protein
VGYGGLVVLPDAFTTDHADLIISRAAKYRLPAIYPFDSMALRGGLVSYGINPTEQFLGAAAYVDRILRGAAIADLPVQAPTRFRLVVNLKTAKAFGLEIPPSLLARADEVIE